MGIFLRSSTGRQPAPIRSYGRLCAPSSTARPAAHGEIDSQLLERYIAAYCRYGTLNDYDRENLYRLYLYQITVCDYYGQYYASDAANREIFLK